MNVIESAHLVVDTLLEDSVAAGADPQAVAQSLGLTFDGEQHWFGMKDLWAFTMRDMDNPYAGVTFYMPVGSSEEDIRARWQEKMSQFGEGTGRSNEPETSSSRPKATFWASSGSGAY